jgi:hypothetical protein
MLLLGRLLGILAQTVCMLLLRLLVVMVLLVRVMLFYFLLDWVFIILCVLFLFNLRDLGDGHFFGRCFFRRRTVG